MNCGSRDGSLGLASVVTDELSSQLWHACAGSIYHPKIGGKVYYFPQGHLEQVTRLQRPQDHNMDFPMHHLPSKILCQVLGVQLKVKVDTDEVFALVTLLPLPEEHRYNLGGNEAHHTPNKVYSFSKILSSAETSANGGIYIPKEHADICFRPLDMTLEEPMQDLVAKDLHGVEWNFRHIYRDDARAHLLTGGWSTFVDSKKLHAGDSCIFLSGENGEIGIGIRRVSNISSQPSTTQNMHFATLATAFHAITTESMFFVQYHPWTNPFGFMVPLRTYVESMQKDYSIGTRVHMISKVEGCVRRYGTIVGNEEIDPIRWPGSEWRCLKVQWDCGLNTYTQPESVCPWWIEVLESSKIKGIPYLPLPNKGHGPNPPFHGLSLFSNEGTLGCLSGLECHRVHINLQDQLPNIKIDQKSNYFIFAFFVFLCFFLFVIFAFRPYM